MIGTDPKLSVILPFYNAENTLQRAIQSIAQQDFDDFECILINNNSTDKSLDIAGDWVEKDNRFRLIHESRQGVMFASNSGAAIASGKYIARMDADDFSRSDRLRNQFSFLENHRDYGAVSGQVNYVSHSDNTEGFVRYVEWVNSVCTFKEIYNSRFIELPVVNPSAMWRKEVGEKYGLYKSGDFPEDYEMWLRWMSMGVKIGKIDEVVLDWYDSESRLTRTNDIYSDAAFYKIKSRYLADWLKENVQIHPKIGVWGASRISRRRAKLLEQFGIEIDSYIDIKRTRKLDKKLYYYKEIPTPEELFILCYIKQSDARDEIQEFLHEKGYTEGENYLLIS